MLRCSFKFLFRLKSKFLLNLGSIENYNDKEPKQCKLKNSIFDIQVKCF